MYILNQAGTYAANSYAMQGFGVDCDKNGSKERYDIVGYYSSTDDITLGSFEDEATAKRVMEFLCLCANIDGGKITKVPTQDEVRTAQENAEKLRRKGFTKVFDADDPEALCGLADRLGGEL